MPRTNLTVGQTIKWPQKEYRLVKGELILIAELTNEEGIILLRRGLISFKAGWIIPSFNPDTTELKFQFKAVTDTFLEEVDSTNSDELIQTNQDSRNYQIWSSIINQLISQNLDIWNKGVIRQIKRPVHIVKAEFTQHIHELMLQQVRQQKEKSADYESIDAHAERRLFLSFEEGDSSQSQSLTKIKSFSNSGVNSQDPLLAALQLISDELDRTITQPKLSPSNQRERLFSILNSSGFIYREVLLNEIALVNDCGQLIGFSDDDDNSPIVLLSSRDGYQVWQPAVMDCPLPIKECSQVLNQLNPRVISVFPGFRKEDLTTMGLLRFSYGQPQNTETFVFTGLLLGLALGFVLSIGNEVGAARWIFGMGASGLLVGGTLGVLSGGFRTAVGVMLLATLLGLLTPTFNTIITNQALPDRDFLLLLQLAGILFIAGMTRVALEWTQSRALQSAQQRGAVRSQFAAMNRLLTLSTDFFRKYTFGDVQMRFAALEQLKGEIQTLLEGGLLKATLTSIYILFMLKISVKLTLLALVIALMLLVPTAIVSLQSRALIRKQQLVAGGAQTRNLELISSVSKLRLAGAEAAAAHWWGDQFRRITSLEMARDAKEGVSKLLQGVMPNLGTLLLYIVISKLASEALQSPSVNSPNIGELLGFFSAFGIFIGSMASLANLFVGAFDVPMIYKRTQPILEAIPESLDDLVDPGDLQGSIALDRVSYRYERRQPLTLQQVSIKVSPGEFIALVGPSGSGKSTIIRMLLGFGDPEEGTVSFDSQPLKGLRKDRVRKQIGTVMQNSSIMTGTIFECIAGGSLISQEQAWEAAEQVAIADDIRQMPMGMQTFLPEGGGTLSGGQRQRLCIARALVNSPKILIFDEATSALDNRTQRLVTESLQAMSITRIAVAHRLSTIRNADRIYVLQAGQIRQVGSFDQLMQQEKGLFANLMKRQMA